MIENLHDKRFASQKAKGDMKKLMKLLLEYLTVMDLITMCTEIVYIDRRVLVLSIVHLWVYSLVIIND